MVRHYTIIRISLRKLYLNFFISFHKNLGDCEVEEGEPRLANVKGDELTVCTDELEEGDEFTLEVEFTSNPKPSKVRYKRNIFPLSIFK